MVSLTSCVLIVAVASTGGLFSGRSHAPQAPYPHPPGHHHHGGGGRVLPPGPGYGWGFQNNNPDGFGWFDHGTFLPLGADRVSSYYFPRNFAVDPREMFFPTYYNPYVMRGQRYLPFTGCGGAHPQGHALPPPTITPMHPYQTTVGEDPLITVPDYTGEETAPPISSGTSGLTP